MMTDSVVTLPDSVRVEDSPPPGFSVIIPVEGRAGLVERLVRSIAQSALDPGWEREVIVVDSSPSPAADETRRACQRHGARYLRGEQSVRRKRNLGARASRYPWLLFLDSDCEASQHLFQAYRSFIANWGHGSAPPAGAGPTRFRGGETWFTRRLQGSSLLDPFRNPEHDGLLLWATASNLLVSREAFDAIGGFRENWPFRLGGDDTDFCLRLRLAGWSLRSAPAAVCWHSWQTWASPWSVIRRSFRWGWMHAVLLEAHPEFRRLEAPGLPVYFASCMLIAVCAVVAGFPGAILAPLLFVLLAWLGHAFLSAAGRRPFAASFFSDLLLALLECPFGVGKLLGSVCRGTFYGLCCRLGADDSDMNHQFPEIVKDLWSNNVALLLTLLAFSVAG